MLLLHRVLTEDGPHEHLQSIWHEEQLDCTKQASAEHQQKMRRTGGNWFCPLLICLVEKAEQWRIKSARQLGYKVGSRWRKMLAVILWGLGLSIRLGR